jgi:hypothetical protein
MDGNTKSTSEQKWTENVQNSMTENRTELNWTPQIPSVIRPQFCRTHLLGHLTYWHGRGGVVDSYSALLRAGQSEDRIPVGANFLHPSRAHPASYTRSTEPQPGVQRSGRGVKHPLPSTTKVKGRIKLHISSPLCLHGRPLGKLLLTRSTSLNFAVLFNFC